MRQDTERALKIEIHDSPDARLDMREAILACGGSVIGGGDEIVYRSELVEGFVPEEQWPRLQTEISEQLSPNSCVVQTCPPGSDHERPENWVKLDFPVQCCTDVAGPDDPAVELCGQADDGAQ